MNSFKEALDSYIQATNSHDFNEVAKLLSDEAVYMFMSQSWVGLNKIRSYFVNSWKAIEDEVYSIEDVKWLTADDRSATCIFIYRWRGMINGEMKEGKGQGTNVFVNEDGEWKVIHEHLSPLS
jgi:uncharacterized protein (TIGR02246 family)